MRTRGWLLGFVFCVLGCGGPSGDIEPIFDPLVLDGSEAFFDFPYPSDLRTDEAGRPQLVTLVRGERLISDATNLVQTERAGFSNQTAVYFRFTGELDAASLPASPAACASESSSIVLIDVDPASPERGRRLPCFAGFRRDASEVWQPNTLVVRPVPGLMFHPGRRYAAVVLDNVRGARGETVAPNDSFRSLQAGAGGELGTHYGELFTELETAGIDRNRIVVASRFTTSDPATELDAARAFVLSQPAPVMRDWTAQRTTSGTVIEATFDTYELFSGEPPYDVFGASAFQFDASGQPINLRTAPVRVAITLPGGNPPAGGFPLVIYGHGTGGSRRSHVGDEGAELAAVGIATLGFDAPFHGDRNLGVGIETLLVSNIVAGREMMRQSVLDVALLVRMAQEGALDVPARVDGHSSIPFARSPILYMGHSQGAQLAGIMLGVEPTIDAAFLSEAGGNSIITVVERPLIGEMTVACFLASVVGETCEEMNEDHPLLTLVVQPLLDPADPLAYAHRMLAERPTDWAPVSIAMTEGLVDMYTPPRTIEALAAAIGLPIVEPVESTTIPYELLGSPTVAAPVSGNLIAPSGAPITGGLMQWPGFDHFVVYQNPDATNRYVQFLRTAALGSPEIVGPP